MPPNMVPLASVIEYLRSNDVPFRLDVYPSRESEPLVAHPVRSHDALSVETRVLLIEGRPAIACIRRGESLNLAGLRNALHAAIVEEGRLQDLAMSEPIASPVPPLGRLFGVPVFVDEEVAKAAVICFVAFSSTDFVEMLYEDFARLEQPRVGDLGIAGELPYAAV